MFDLSLSALLEIAAGALLLLAGFAAFAERRRNARRDIDRPGLMPWHLIQILAAFAAFGAVGLAMKL